MKWQKSILAYLFILLTGFSVFFTPKKYQHAPLQHSVVKHESQNTDQKENKSTENSQNHDYTAALTRAGVKLVVYNFFEVIPVFYFSTPKLVEKNIDKPYFARLLVFSFHLEHLFFGIIAPNAP